MKTLLLPLAAASLLITTAFAAAPPADQTITVANHTDCRCTGMFPDDNGNIAGCSVQSGTGMTIQPQKVDGSRFTDYGSPIAVDQSGQGIATGFLESMGNQTFPAYHISVMGNHFPGKLDTDHLQSTYYAVTTGGDMAFLSIVDHLPSGC